MMGTQAAKESNEYVGWRYHVKQQAGLFLGSLSLFLAWATFDEDSEWAVTKLMCCLALCIAACGVHEIRPYQVCHSKLPCLTLFWRPDYCSDAY